MRRAEAPLRRENPGGEVRWVARYTNDAGERKSAGTYPVKGPCRQRRDDGECCAQHRIWWAYEQDQPEQAEAVTVRGYFEGDWLRRHPRSERTEAGYKRIRAVMGTETKDGPFGDLQLALVRPRHLDDLVDVMLREHGRAVSGARKIIDVISAMFMDAIRDELAEMNPALVVTIRDSDPRAQKARRKRVVFTWGEMHDFARAAGEHEAAVRVLSDCGLRLGELFALERCHDCRSELLVENNAWHGRVAEGTKQGDGRLVPVAPGLRAVLDSYATPLHGPLFPAPGGGVWSDGSWYRRVWYPAMERSGLAILPHDMRHSFVSHLRAAGVDPADLAAIAGHSVETATAKYTHSTGTTFEAARRAVG